MRLTNFDIGNRFSDDLIHIEKWHPNRPITVVYYDGEKELHYVKRFLVDVKSDKKTLFISESEDSRLDVVSTAYQPQIKVIYNKRLKETKNLPDSIIDLEEFIDVKGMKTLGNQLTKLKVKEIELTHPIEGDKPWPKEETENKQKEEADNYSDDEEDDEEMDDSTKTTSNKKSGDNDESPREVKWANFKKER